MVCCCFGSSPTNSLRQQFFPPTSQYLPQLFKYNGISLKCSGKGFESPTVDFLNKFHCVMDHTSTALSKKEIFGIHHFAMESSDTVIGSYSSQAHAMENNFTFEYSTKFPGVFVISFDLILHAGGVALQAYRSGSVTVQRRDASQAATFTVASIATKTIDTTSPPCIDNINHLGDGYWLKCSSVLYSSAFNDCNAWGYVFVPDGNMCGHHTWNHDELMVKSRAPEKRWIVVVGCSIRRGVYFRAIGLLLGPEASRNMAVVDKCWGRIDVEVGNIKLTFVDFRGPVYGSWPPKNETFNAIECHGNRVMSNEFEFQNNSVHFMKSLFADPYH